MKILYLVRLCYAKLPFRWDIFQIIYNAPIPLANGVNIAYILIVFAKFIKYHIPRETVVVRVVVKHNGHGGRV